MNHHDAILHVRGESRFVADEPLPANTAFAAVVSSPVAHGRLLAVEIRAAAAASDGVLAVLTHRGIPGRNQIGSVSEDEPLLAADAVHYVGQPVALVIALTEKTARRAGACLSGNTGRAGAAGRGWWLARDFLDASAHGRAAGDREGARLACLSLLGRLREVAAGLLDVAGGGDIEFREERVWLAGKATGVTCAEVVRCLPPARQFVSPAHYATPRIHFDKTAGQGEPFLYHAVGVGTSRPTLWHMITCLKLLA